MGAVLCMNLLTLSGCDRVVQSAVVEEKDQTEQKKEEKKETVQKIVAEQVQAPETYQTTIQADLRSADREDKETPMTFTLTADAPVKVPDVDAICLKKVKRVAIPEEEQNKIKDTFGKGQPGINHIKKFRKDHKINSNVTLSRRQKLMFCILIKKQQLTLSNHYFLAVYNIGDRALAYIKHLNKIVSVSREINKPGMGTHSDQLTLIQHLSAVYNEIPA